MIVTTGASGLVLETKIAYGDFLMRPEKTGSLQEVTISDFFFGETNPESPFSTRME